MKAITLHQPWATLVALGVKTIETRSWATKHRGPIAIHAGMDYETFRIGEKTGWVSGSQMLWNRDDKETFAHGNPFNRVPLGAIVATAVDCVPMVEIAADPPHNHLTLAESWMHLWRYVGNPDGTRRTWSPWNPLGNGTPTDVEAQRPFGHFAPGRFAWILDDIKPCDPVPARGYQGLWDWSGA